MKSNEDQFIQDILNTFQDTNVFYVSLFMCLLFNVIGIFFSVSMFEEVLPYINTYDTYMSFFILSIICMIMGVLGLLTLITYYYNTFLHSKNKQCIQYLPLIFASMIPGFLMLMYVVMVGNIDLSIPISYLSLIFCIYAYIFIFIFYFFLQHKINQEKFVYQKRTYQTFQSVLIIGSLIIMCSILLFRGLFIEDLIKIGILIVVVTFMAYQSARTMLAYVFERKMKKEEIMEREYYIDGSLGSENNSLKERVYIINDGHVDKVLNILEEFGFQREKCMNAILHNQPIYTFNDKMFYDIHFMKKLLMRLAYESISFRVEERTKDGWKENVQYQKIEKRCFIRRKKEEISQEDDSDSKNSTITDIIIGIFFFIGLAIYGVWSFIFPVNYFKPTRWSSYKQIQKYYKQYTYPSFRTIYHMIGIWIVFITFICVPSLQVWFAITMDTTEFVVKSVFVIICIGELFHFPLYMKKLKEITEGTIEAHNFEKRAFVVCICIMLIKAFFKGVLKFLCMFILLVISVEIGKSIHVIIRYAFHYKESYVIKENEEYEIVEYYDMSEIEKRIHKIEQSIIQLEYKSGPITIYSSHLGGKPYWVKGEEYPMYDGKPLMLLVQINFGELKDHIDGYPSHGILQFFINDDDTYGSDFNGKVNKKYRVIYHEKIDYDESHLEDIQVDHMEESPVLKPVGLNLLVKKERGLSSNDFQFDERLKEICQDILPLDLENNSMFIEQLYDICQIARTNKMGGQGVFSQEDPRNDKSMLILLQLVSDEKYMQWGDDGTCHFFIHEDDLKAKRFDRVVYDWDCY